MTMNAGDTETIAPPSEQLRLKIEWDKRMGITSNPVRYNKTAALLLYWCEEDSDLATGTEVFDLRRVFQEDYNFTVHTAAMNTKKSPALQAKSILTQFVLAEDDRHTLLIVYYAGHGYSKVSTDGNIMLTGKLDHNTKYSIDWASVEFSLRGTDSDILLIFDCCHAGLLCKPFTRSRPEVCVQILAACQNHQTTRKAGRESFTQALIFALKELKSKQRFSTLTLLNTLTGAPHFPRDEQAPQLSHRFAESGQDCIQIARMTQDEECPLSPVLDYKESQYLDVRLHFPHALNDDVVWETCDALRTLIARKEISARQIHLMGKNRLAPYVEKAVLTFRNAIVVSRERRATGNSQAPVMLVADNPSMGSVDAALSTPGLVESDEQPRLVRQSSSALPLYLNDERTPLLPESAFGDEPKAQKNHIVYRFKTAFRRLVNGLFSIFWLRDRRSSPQCRGTTTETQFEEAAQQGAFYSGINSGRAANREAVHDMA